MLCQKEARQSPQLSQLAHPPAIKPDTLKYHEVERPLPSQLSGELVT